MFYGIGKYFGFTLAVLLCVLLSTKHHGLCSIDLVDAVDDCIKPFHLLELFGIVVEQVQLHGGIWTNSHDDDTGFLVVIALNVDALV